jgi:hypothetical protein
LRCLFPCSSPAAKTPPEIVAGVKPGLQLGRLTSLGLGNRKRVLVVGREPIRGKTDNRPFQSVRLRIVNAYNAVINIWLG